MNIVLMLFLLFSKTRFVYCKLIVGSALKSYQAWKWKKTLPISHYFTLLFEVKISVCSTWKVSLWIECWKIIWRDIFQSLYHPKISLIVNERRRTSILQNVHLKLPICIPFIKYYSRVPNKSVGGIFFKDWYRLYREVCKGNLFENVVTKATVSQ